jgi:hypothetical protein
MNKFIPPFDPYTGELNPLYEELTGQPNPWKSNLPTPPLMRLIKEGTIGTCSVCKSTEVKRFIFFGQSIGCINPPCSRYYKK